MFYTHDHVDLDIDVVKRALASSLQRDGVVVSLGEGYRAVESGDITYGYSGYVDGDYHLTKSDESGETYYGNQVDVPLETTWVEIER